MSDIFNKILCFTHLCGPLQAVAPPASCGCFGALYKHGIDIVVLLIKIQSDCICSLFFIALVPVESLFMLFCFLHVAIFQRPLDRGDVLLSLSYLPTAERLVLVVVKARNLAWPTTKPAGGKKTVARARHAYRYYIRAY